ncbi:MAG: hypothetical protein ABR520_00735 [Mycobacteriales bacterium]|nr:hypothetical protein [Frankia sp.]
MRRGLLIRAATGALLLGVAGVSGAAPSANVTRAAEAFLYIQSARGTHYLHVTALSGLEGTDASTAHVRVEVARCTAAACVDGVTYAADVPMRVVTVADDFSSAVTSFTFAGRPLTVRWSRSAQTPRAHGEVLGGGSAADFSALTTVGYTADARVQLGSLACAADDAIVGAGVDAANPSRTSGYAAFPRQLPAGLQGRLTCGQRP